MVEFFNGMVHLGIGIALVGAVLSKKVKDGIVVKTGLILLAVAFLGLGCMLVAGIEWGSAVYIARALALQSMGLLVLLAGYLIRRHRAGTPLTRISDWIDFDDSQQARPSAGRKS